jgi:hypothetical protein
MSGQNRRPWAYEQVEDDHIDFIGTRGLALGNYHHLPTKIKRLLKPSGAQKTSGGEVKT